MSAQSAPYPGLQEGVRLKLIEALRRRPAAEGAPAPCHPPAPNEGNPAVPAADTPPARRLEATGRTGTPQTMRFETWVPFEINAALLEVAQRIASANEAPRTPDLLYVYSPPGLGKTHLLHAIANQRGRDVLLINVVQLASALARANRMGTVPHLRDWLTSARLLLLDDIQTCEDDSRLQKMLQTAVARMLDSGRGVVVSADAPPRGLRRIRSKLLARLGSGATGELAMGSSSERLEVLRAVHLPVPVDDDVLRAIAESVGDSIRRLKAVALRTARLAKQRGEPATVAMADEALLAESGCPITVLPRPSGAVAAPPPGRGLTQVLLDRFHELERQARCEAEVALALQIAINERIRELRYGPGGEPEVLEGLRAALSLSRSGDATAALEALGPLG